MSTKEQERVEKIMRDFLKQRGKGCYAKGSEVERRSHKRGLGQIKSESESLRVTLEDLSVF